jgi:phosphonoacetaldehyde hydrolase
VREPAQSREGVRAVVFDWAGTTVDYGSMAPVEAFVRAFAAHGLDVSQADVRGPMGHAKREHLAALLALPAVAAQWMERHGREATGGDAERLYAEVGRLLLPVALEHADPLPGVAEAVAALRERGIKIGSCTGYPREVMAGLAPAAAERGYAPDVVVTPDDVPRGRPSPFMCYLNALRLEVFPLGHMVKVGDTPADVHEGRAAGMWTIGTLRGGNEVGLSAAAEAELSREELEDRLAAARARLLEAGAHYAARSIAELPEIVNDIDRRLARGEEAMGGRRGEGGSAAEA